MSDRMSFEERYQRDGDRWRYIYLLERELGFRKSRRRALIASLIANAIFGAVIIWLSA